MLAERLKKVLPFIIDDSQAAFVEGRHLIDAILVALEVVVDWKTERGVFFIKLDLKKSL